MLTSRRLWEMLPPEERAKIPPPPVRKKRHNEESEMQRALIRWWTFTCRQFGVPEILLASCPNGGGRSGPIVGAILKAEGLRKGFPDLGLYVKRGVHGALFLELKTERGHVAPEQEVFHQILREQGYAVAVCRSLRQAQEEIKNYLIEH